jgi:signal transduction histidine kinase
VRVTLALKENKIILSIEDNGKGFALIAANYGNGIGNMRNRLGDIGGTFNIESNEGSGTRVTFEIPIGKPV